MEGGEASSQSCVVPGFPCLRMSFPWDTAPPQSCVVPGFLSPRIAFHPSRNIYMEQSSLHQLIKAMLSVMCQSPWGWNSRRAFCPPQVSNTKAGLQMLKIAYTKIPSTCWNYKAEAAGPVSKSSSCNDTQSRWQGAGLQRRPSSDIWGREHKAQQE